MAEDGQVFEIDDRSDLSDRRPLQDALAWIAPAYVHVDVSAGPAATTPAARVWVRAALDAARHGGSGH